MSGVASTFREWSFVTFIMGAFSFVVGVAALPLRFILRENLGERTVRPFSFVLAIALHIYYFTVFDAAIMFVSVLSVSGDPFQTLGLKQFIYAGLFILFNPYSLFLFWSIRRAIKHYKQKIRDALNNDMSYTYYRGDSRYFKSWHKPTIYGFEANDKTIRVLGEPKAICVIGFAIAIVSAVILATLILIVETESLLLLTTAATFFATGLVLVLDSVFLAIDEVSLVLSRRDKVLDILDSERDAQTIVEQKDVMKFKHNLGRQDKNTIETNEDDWVQD